MILGTVAVGQLNWYNLPALFPIMTSQLNLTISQLGVISAAFVVGFGVIQVPAGILAAKVGLRSTVLSGAILISVFSLLVTLFSNPYEIAIMRLVAGAGMALVYAPGMMLAMRQLREGTQSLGIGLYSAVGDIGGIVGLFGWALLADRIGWRQSVDVSAGLGLAFALLLFFILPREDRGSGFEVKLSDLRKVLLSRGLLLVCFALLGMECGWNAVAYFVVFYLQTQLKVGVGVSGFVGGLVLGGAILGALVMPRLYDRIRGSKRGFFLLGVACAASVVLISTGTLYGAILGVSIEGFLNGLAFSFGLVMARKLVPVARYDALGVAWISEIAIFGSSWSTLLFTSLVGLSGYPVAWSITSLVGIFFILPVLKLGTGSGDLRRAAIAPQQGVP